MSLLDTVLDNTAAGSRIVSEEHDPNAINFVAGLADPGEMIRCGYLPQIRRRDGEQDAEYAERIRPIVMALPKNERDQIMGAAVRRASLDTNNGRVNAMFAGKPAWHGLGVVVDKAATSADAIRFAGLDWQVVKVPLGYEWEGRTHYADDTFAVVRADTGRKLGTGGSRYEPVQNAQGFDFLDGVLAEYGARYETAGSIYGGKRVWMLAHLPEQRFEVQPGDVTEPYVMFSNCHDGSGSAWCLPTTVRTECANTYRIAMQDKGKGISIRHTGNVADKIGEARAALGLAVESIGDYRQVAEAMVKAPCEVRHYANDVLDAVLEVTEAQAMQGADALAAMLKATDAERELARKSFARLIDRRGELLEDILGRYESERCRPRGTVWAAFNSVTEHADHMARRQVGTEEMRLSRRFESILTGEADALKQVAFEKAAALAV